MTASPQSLSWHRTIAKLIMHLDRPDFWESLVKTMREYINIDNWAVLVFSHNGAQIVSLPEKADTEELDAFHQLYIKGLFRLDPFYIANREDPQSGFFHLQDIAPEHFHQTEYYTQYFSQYISTDEVQYNIKLSNDQTLCISFGSRMKYGTEQIVVLEIIQPWMNALIHQRVKLGIDTNLNFSTPTYWPDEFPEITDRLTSRENEVLRYIRIGFSNKEIAGRLCISADTVKVHKRNIYQKLDVRLQSELFALLRKPTA
ncbi:helix-turn-helix domain-containing protein [Pseudomonas asplenii]|uniref:helix-turn-helix domain-containing protein n=1 Tax=Pseudomonas asplenii TaxID=53407 RepID=UPI0003619E97|nr:helix-turn-helix transcriptional regulator [Pseudomonas fuscovaginae]